MKVVLVSIVISLALILHSCKPMPSDGVPIYLKIDSVNVITLPSQGLGTHNIKDVWVEAGADNLGAYELPCNFPVLKENEVRFIISAGIEESGQSNVRVIYPFYQPDSITINAARTTVYPHLPIFRYKAGTQFAFTPESFDAGNGFTDMPLVTDTNVRYGTRCGVLTVTLTDSSKMAYQNTSYPLPRGQEIWLELDYKNEVPFFAGIYASYGLGNSVRVPVLFINPRPYWNKTYIKLSNLVGALNAGTYNVYFEALRPYGTQGGKVYIDNVKILHF